MTGRSYTTLSSEEPARMAAVDQLVALGEEGVQPLLAQLSDPSWAVRRAVVAALGSIGQPAVRPLCELLRRRDDETRLAATVDALVASTGQVEPELVRLADDEHPGVVADVAQVLGRRRASGAIPLLVRLTRHDNDNVAVAAIEALGRIGGRAAVESLIEIVSESSFFRTFPAIDVLGRSGDPRVVAPLARLLDHPQFAPEAARALGRTGERAAVEPLVSLLSRPVEALVRVAAVALAELAERHRERYGESETIEDAVAQAIGDGRALRHLAGSAAAADPAEQVALCRVLGSIDSDDSVAVITSLLDQPEPVTSAAAAALRRLGERSEAQTLALLRHGDSQRRLALLPVVSRRSATSAVVDCLADPDPAVRAAACDALARLGDPSVVRHLFAAIEDDNPRVQQSAVGAIEALGSVETERLAMDAARSANPAVRRAAFRILSYFGYPEALPLLVGALGDDDVRVRDAAIQGLPYLDDPRALDALLEAARSPHERVRAAVMRALGHTRGDVRVAAMLLRGVSDPDPWARYFAAQSLGRLQIERAAPALARLLDDPAGQVRVAGIEALSHLRGELAFSALRRAASAADADVSRAALIGLGISRRPEAQAILLEASGADDPATRLVAVSALADFDSPEVLRALERAASDPAETVRTAAIGFLAGRSGPGATTALVHLLPAASDRERIVAALSVPVDGRVDALIDELARADDETAPLLVAALIRMRRSDAAAALVGAMDLPNPAARKAVASALPALRTRAARLALDDAAERDIDPEVRRIAALGLGR